MWRPPHVKNWQGNIMGLFLATLIPHFAPKVAEVGGKLLDNLFGTDEKDKQVPEYYEEGYDEDISLKVNSASTQDDDISYADIIKNAFSSEHAQQTAKEIKNIMRELKQWPELDDSQFRMKMNTIATLLAATLIADGEYDEAEIVVVCAVAKALDYEAEEMLEAVDVALNKQANMSLEDFEEKLEDIADTLSKTKRIILFTLCSAMTISDEELCRKEKRLLIAFAKLFNISSEELSKITNLLHEVTGIKIKLV